MTRISESVSFECVSIRTHTFRGHRWRVKDNTNLDRDSLALCDHDAKTLWIPLDGDTLAELDWIVHESLHACFPDLSEDAVDECASDIARLAWRLNWRKDEC